MGLYTSSQAFAGRSSQLTFGTQSPSAGQNLVSEPKNINFTGSKYDLADVTNMESGNFREWLPTLADAGELSFVCNYLPLDATQALFIQYYNNAVLLYWQVILPGGRGTISFTGYIVSVNTDVPLDKEATISVKVKITGSIVLP